MQVGGEGLERAAVATAGSQRSSKVATREVLSSADKKLLFWFGMVLLAAVTVIARLVTGTWWGILLWIGYVVAMLAPLGTAGSTSCSSGREEQLESEVRRLREVVNSYEAKQGSES